MPLLTLDGEERLYPDMLQVASQVQSQYPLMQEGEQVRAQLGSNQYDVKKNAGSWTVEQVGGQNANSFGQAPQ